MRCLVVGPAKSGTTAVLTLIGQAMNAPSLFFEEPLARVVPAMQACTGDSVAKVIFDHEPEAAIARAAEGCDRRVLLSRDPRDVLVSSVLYVVANKASNLADDAFLDRLLSLVHAKQADPASVPFRDIASLFDTQAQTYVDHVLGQQAQFAHFLADAGAAWYVLHYEDLVNGQLADLSLYLGLPLGANVKVASRYARVERTRSSGDWRHWFTPADVAALRPACDPLLDRQGYATEWALAPTPRIAPEHSWRYLERLIDERLDHYNHPPRTVAARGSRACNLCGGTVFGPGPAGRMAANGSPPRCLGCDALERQRIMRRVLQALPLGFLDWRRVLQYSRDNGLPEAVFQHVDARVAAPGAGFPSLSYGDADVDLVVFSHLLEYVQDDLGGFAEMARRLSSRGFMLGSFSAPWSRASTLGTSGATGVGPWRLYGRDLAQHFQCAESGLIVLAVEADDACTDAKEVVHLFFKDGDDAARVCKWLLDGGDGLSLLSWVGPTGAATDA